MRLLCLLVVCLARRIDKMPTSFPLMDLTPIPLGKASVLSHQFKPGALLYPHAHDVAQLLFASRGLMQVKTPKGQWLVPPQRAVWIPPATEHAIEVLSELEMRSVYVRSAQIEDHPQADALGREFVTVVDPLLRGLIVSLFRPIVNTGRIELVINLILFELVDSEDPTTFIPMPLDRRARRVAELAMADCRGLRSLADMAGEAGVSQRTIARLFPLETSLTFKKWRQRARMMTAIEELGRERALVKQVAAKMGYSSIAAFAAAFHTVFGVTPTEFRNRSRNQGEG